MCVAVCFCMQQHIFILLRPKRSKTHLTTMIVVIMIMTMLIFFNASVTSIRKYVCTCAIRATCNKDDTRWSQLQRSGNLHHISIYCSKLFLLIILAHTHENINKMLTKMLLAFCWYLLWDYRLWNGGCQSQWKWTECVQQFRTFSLWFVDWQLPETKCNNERTKKRKRDHHIEYKLFA